MQASQHGLSATRLIIFVQLDADVGVPRGPGAETAPGVWRRSWTKADVALDCTTWTGTVQPTGGPLYA